MSLLLYHYIVSYHCRSTAWNSLSTTRPCKLSFAPTYNILTNRIIQSLSLSTSRRKLDSPSSRGMSSWPMLKYSMLNPGEDQTPPPPEACLHHYFTIPIIKADVLESRRHSTKEISAKIRLPLLPRHVFIHNLQHHHLYLLHKADVLESRRPNYSGPTKIPIIRTTEGC